MLKTEAFTYLGKCFSPNETHQILEKITDLSKNQLFFADIIETDFGELDSYIYKKNQKIPFEYIVEKSVFYGRDFFVNQNVLIPRDDTEVLVNACLSTLKKSENITVVDIGSGSGAIGITLALESKNISVQYAIDISKKALEVTQVNLDAFHLDKNILCREGSLFSLTQSEKNTLSDFVCITANLPYIKKNDFHNMDESVYLHEPELALYGGEETGFELYETLTDQLIKFKNEFPEKKLVAWYEIGFDQFEYSKKYLLQKGLKFEYFQDMAKINRCIQVEF